MQTIKEKKMSVTGFLLLVFGVTLFTFFLWGLLNYIVFGTPTMPFMAGEGLGLLVLISAAIMSGIFAAHTEGIERWLGTLAFGGIALHYIVVVLSHRLHDVWLLIGDIVTYSIAVVLVPSGLLLVMVYYLAVTRFYARNTHV